MNEKLAQFTDEELLLELRHRERLKRIEADYIIEGWRLRMGEGAFPPDEYIQINLAKCIGEKIGHGILAGKFKVPGQRVERGGFQMFTDPVEPDKKFILPLNFVVEP